MLTLEELETLLRDLESDRVERTTSTTKTDKFAEAICAFANDFPDHRQPGYLMVGVNDDGTPSGLKVTDELLTNLAAIRADGNVQPLPAMTVSKFSPGDGDVALVEVLPSDLPPVKYRGRVWIRVGPRRQVASEQEERLLAERRAALLTTFDARPCQGSSLDDLDTRLFSTPNMSIAPTAGWRGWPRMMAPFYGAPPSGKSALRPCPRLFPCLTTACFSAGATMRAA